MNRNPLHHPVEVRRPVIPYFITFFTLISATYSLYMIGGSGTPDFSYLRYVIIPVLFIAPIVWVQSRWLAEIYPNLLMEFLVHYGGFVLFMFLAGLSFSWGQKVGSAPAGSLLGLLDGAIRMATLGQFIGIVFFLPLFAIYWITRRYFFD